MVVRQLVAKDERNLFFEHLVLTCHDVGVGCAWEKAGRGHGNGATRTNAGSSHADVFVDLVGAKLFIMGLGLRQDGFDLQEPVGDGHGTLAAFAAGSERVDFARGVVHDQRDPRDSALAICWQRGYQLPQDGLCLLPQENQVGSGDGIVGYWRPWLLHARLWLDAWLLDAWLLHTRLLHTRLLHTWLLWRRLLRLLGLFARAGHEHQTHQTYRSAVLREPTHAGQHSAFRY